MIRNAVYLIILGIVVSCAQSAPTIDLSLITEADNAVQRAVEAEAPTYAPEEFEIAADLQDQMHNEVDASAYEQALDTAEKVIAAANAAIRAARERERIQK